MPWSCNKLDAFYHTDLGKHVREIILKNLNKTLEKLADSKVYSDDQEVLSLGYDLFDKKFSHYNKLPIVEHHYDIVLACHCEELQICVGELAAFCETHLKDNGVCIILTSNGNGCWSHTHTPFSKYRTYKSIKTFKRAHFKLIKKNPMLFCTLNMHKKWSALCNIWENILKKIWPNYAGAMLLVVQKQVIKDLTEKKIEIKNMSDTTASVKA